MPVHQEVLDMAQYLCAAKRKRTFEVREIVEALPHLNEGTVRTHITSRCCTNAPANHAHQWPYFKRVGRGVYEICDPYRPPEARRRPAAVEDAPQGQIHTVIRESEGFYVAECLEVAVVTQGNSLDETLSNLREAVALFLSDEEPADFGLVANPRLSISFETTALQCPA